MMRIKCVEYKENYFKGVTSTSLTAFKRFASNISYYAGTIHE